MLGNDWMTRGAALDDLARGGLPKEVTLSWDLNGNEDSAMQRSFVPRALGSLLKSMRLQQALKCRMLYTQGITGEQVN